MKRSILLFVMLIAVAANAQTTGYKGAVERILVHGKGLEGNLEGDSPDRHVSVYLPPSYKANPKKRYPVIYFLHGYTDSDDKWYGFTKHWINLPQIADSVFATGKVQEAILVTPDAYTRFQGSMYSNSATTGNWEDYVAKELVAYIDTHYRTLAKRESRGLAGHSMGGYGTMRIGQKHPEIFSSLYLLSPCCLAAEVFTPSSELINRIEAVKDTNTFLKADFGTKIFFASAAAWSPNPVKAPFYLDLPVQNGQVQPDVIAKWTANRPLAQLDQYITNLRQLQAIAFDAGDKDKNIAASIQVLDRELNKYGVLHDFDLYEGDHTNRIAERISQRMLPFFASHLKAQ
jgi:S-formylglutathione hydrolase